MDAAPSSLNQENQNSPQEVIVKREPEKDLVVWTAPGRPFKKRDRQFFVTVFAIAGIVSLVVFLAEGIMPVVLIISLVFLYYILSTVPPDAIEYRITTKGIKIADKITPWQTLTRFWFGKRLDSEILFFDSILIPGRIELVITPDIKDSLTKQISPYITYENGTDSGIDKITSWISQKLPGNG